MAEDLGSLSRSSSTDENTFSGSDAVSYQEHWKTSDDDSKSSEVFQSLPQSTPGISQNFIIFVLLRTKYELNDSVSTVYISRYSIQGLYTRTKLAAALNVLIVSWLDYYNYNRIEWITGFRYDISLYVLSLLIFNEL